MPPKGFRTLYATLPENIYAKLEAYAKKNFTTIPKAIEKLLAEAPNNNKHNSSRRLEVPA